MSKIQIYILTTIGLLLTACSNETPVPEQGGCELHLNLYRVGVEASQTRAIDNDLALKILDSKGDVYIQYRAGSVPSKIVLSPGTFTVQAYTENQNTWPQENNGRGAACYYGTCEVEMEFDKVTYANMKVPMTNYAVMLTLPDLFDYYFPTYTFSLKSGFRETEIKHGEKAYFNPQEGGFTYQLTATNTDQVTHHTPPITYSNVENGKLYSMTYYYGTDDNTGGLDIEIRDNMEDEDVVVPITE